MSTSTRNQELAMPSESDSMLVLLNSTYSSAKRSHQSYAYSRNPGQLLAISRHSLPDLHAGDLVTKSEHLNRRPRRRKLSRWSAAFKFTGIIPLSFKIHSTDRTCELSALTHRATLGSQLQRSKDQLTNFYFYPLANAGISPTGQYSSVIHSCPEFRRPV